MNWCILKNEFDDNHLNWEKACKKFNQNYRIIDLTKSDWGNKILKEKFDGYLTCPSGRESLFKELYDERLYVINNTMGKFCYPNFDEVIIHENKKFLSYWLEANDVPHPKTTVFYDRNEAFNYISLVKLPIVAKFNIGASGKGVKIFRKPDELSAYIESAFSIGVRQNWGPNLKMGGLKTRLIKIIKKPSRIKNRIEVYKRVYNEIQKGFIILQEYIPHDYEWRIVKIGESYFGHQKVKQGDKASGTKGIDYVIPPANYLNFVKNLCEKFKFNSMAVDLFEDGKGGLLVNELQTIFGHVQGYICEKNGKPGRLIFLNNEWIFEEGIFNTNLSYDLRLEHAISLVDKNKLQ